MERVKATKTSLELKLRKIILDMGRKGYRIHYDALPGKTEVVFTKLKKALFSHGCFSHSHDCKAEKNTPKINKDYWEPKLNRNVERDKER